MQEFLLESPILLTACGLAATGVAAFIWTQTGHRAAWISALVLVLLTVVLVVVSVQVETDREQIQRTIEDVAGAVESNDLNRVIKFLHPNSVAGIRHIESEMPRYRFEEARVTRLHAIRVNQDSTPATAVAEFNVVVELSLEGQKIRVARFVKTYFMQRGGEWLVTDYEHSEPTAGFRRPEAP